MTWLRELRRTAACTAPCSCASVGVGWPLAGFGAVLRFCGDALREVRRVGHDGRLARRRSAAGLAIAAIVIQWSKVVFGDRRAVDLGDRRRRARSLPPQAASDERRATKTAPSARADARVFMVIAAQCRRTARARGVSVSHDSSGERAQVPATRRARPRAARRRRARPPGSAPPESSGTRSDSCDAARLVAAPPGAPRAARCAAPRVELDRRDRQPAAAEADRARAGLAELDARLLQREQVLQRLGHRAEAVLELLAQRAEVGDLARAGDRGGGRRSSPARRGCSRPGT